MKNGGNAVDAAIATLLCNGVVHSHSMGLGGGFFMTIYKKDEGKAYFLNAREVAPLAATEDMFDDYSSQIGTTDGSKCLFVLQKRPFLLRSACHRRPS